MTSELTRAMSMYQDLVSDMTAHRGDLAALRRCYSSWFERFPIAPDADYTHLDVDGVPVVQVRTPAVPSTSTIIHLHSGGYTLGAAKDYRAMGAALSRAAKATVLLVDYRLAPENPYPAALDDAFTVYQWATREATAGLPVVLSGDSAGGGLVLSLILRLRQQGVALPVAAVAISPFADLALTGASLESNRSRDLVCHPEALAYFARGYAAGTDLRDPLLSPLYGDLSGLPPLLILVGEAETLRDDGIRLAERARSGGTPVCLDVVPSMPHIFPVFHDFLPEAEDAIRQMGEFVRRVLTTSA